MNGPSNAPVSAESESTGFAGWISTWRTAVTKPFEQTYASMAEHPDAASNSRAFTWVFVAGTISALVSGVLQAILTLLGFVRTTPGFSEAFGSGSGDQSVLFTFGLAICGSPVVGAISTLAFAIFIGITQWVARMFKGTGTYSQLAYTMAAISVPLTLFSGFTTPLSVVPILGICTGILSLALGLYALYLEIMAVKGVNKFGTGPAVASVLLPVLVLMCCAVAVVATMVSLGGVIGETFNSINQSLAP